MKKGYLKIINLFIFAFLIIFVEVKCISAAQYKYKGTTYDYDENFTALYCGYQENFYNKSSWEIREKFFEFFSKLKGDNKLDFNACIKVYKPGIYDSDSGVVNYQTNLVFDTAPIYVYTVPYDEIYKQEDKNLWWKSLRYCYSFGLTKQTIMLFTDYLSTTTNTYADFIASSDCLVLENKTTDSDHKIDSCPALSNLIKKMYDNINKYNFTKKVDYITNYKRRKEEIRSVCSQVLKYSDYSEACMNVCIDIEKVIYAKDKELGISSTGKCGFSARLGAWVMNILKWIKYIIPVVVIILSSLDFIKATSSDKDDNMKKAQGNFVKRLIAAALIFLIPLIIEFILTRFGFDYNSCGLF